MIERIQGKYIIRENPKLVSEVINRKKWLFNNMPTKVEKIGDKIMVITGD